MARKAIDAIEDALNENRRFFVLEFFPPKTAEGEANLYPRMEKLTRQLHPLWCALTHGDSPARQLSMAQTAQAVLSIDMQLNVIANAFRRREDLAAWLDEVRQVGVRNLLLMRGIAPPPPENDFQTAADLVRFVRARYGTHFCLSVVGHPEGYECDPATYDRSLADLKEKVDAGADLVITEMCFSSPILLKFCADCRERGVRCPILPGIMPVQSRAQFRHWFDRAGCEALKARVEGANRHDDAEVKRIGVEFTTQLVKQLFRGGVRGAYFFTMNMETVVASLVDAVGLSSSSRSKEMPWRQSVDMSRSRREQQRPIYWSARPAGYMARTLSAPDDFPNGRYGDAMSPAFGENTTYHTTLALTAAARNCHWMFAAKSLRDVCNGFVAYLQGRGRLPWCEESLAPEADIILESALLPLNRRGLLTINSQPAANGLPSDDAKCGWGPPGGFVYQKQYLEFFCSREVLARVVPVFLTHPSLAFMALDARGNVVDMTRNYHRGGSGNASTSNTAMVSPITPGSGVGSGQGLFGASTSSAPPESPTTHEPVPANGSGNVNANANANSRRFSGSFDSTGRIDGAGSGGSNRGGDDASVEEATTVTWGVFPNRPVLQPTIVSLAAFRAWAPEAFSLWRLPFLRNAAGTPPPAGSAMNSAGGSARQTSSPPPQADNSSSTGEVTSSGGQRGGTASSELSPEIGTGQDHRRRSSVKFALLSDDCPREMPTVLRTIAAEWVLVSVVDNNFTASPTPLDTAVAEISSLLPEIAPAGAPTGPGV